MKIYKNYSEAADFSQFFWSGAREKWAEATEGQRQAVLTRLEDWYGDGIVEDTAINDAVWFECDDIFFREESGEE